MPDRHHHPKLVNSSLGRSNALSTDQIRAAFDGWHVAIASAEQTVVKHVTTVNAVSLVGTDLLLIVQPREGLDRAIHDTIQIH